jgi:GTP-binding protein
LPSATFLAAAANARQFPPEGLPEIAFLGRSNAGKSSLLNALAGARGLAFTSRTPGRTQTVNFFRVEGKWIFADLPGYGYSRAPKEISAHWGGLIESYLSSRASLALSILLVDSRHGFLAGDLQMRDWLEHYERPYLVAATKVDKLNQKQRSESQRAIRSVYREGNLIWCSAVTGQGVKEIWQTISKTTSR